MSDPLKDDRFPDRPQHPDFWRISEVVLQHDGDAVEAGRSMEEIVKDTVDLESLTYFAMQRAGTYCQAMGLPKDFETLVGSVWMDAFMAGARYEERGGHQA